MTGELLVCLVKPDDSAEELGRISFGEKCALKYQRQLYYLANRLHRNKAVPLERSDSEPSDREAKVAHHDRDKDDLG